MLNDFVVQEYGKNVGYKETCDDSEDDTSSINNNPRLDIIDNSFSDSDNEHNLDTNNPTIRTITSGSTENKVSRPNSSFSNLWGWKSTNEIPADESKVKTMSKREAFKNFFKKGNSNDEEKVDEDDVESDDGKYETVYDLKTKSRSNSFNKLMNQSNAMDMFESKDKLNDQQISKTKFGKVIRDEGNTDDTKEFKGILKLSGYKSNLVEGRPKSVSFESESKTIDHDIVDKGTATENHNYPHSVEPLSGDTLASPVKLEIPKEKKEYFNNKIDLSKGFNQKEPDDDEVVLKTNFTLNKRAIKFLQTVVGSSLEESLLKNPKRLLEIYATYIANLKTQAMKREADMQKSTLEREKLELLLKESNDRIKQLELENAQLKKDKEDSKKKLGGLFKKIKTIKKESKNNKNMKRYYNDFISAYCGMVTTLATENTTFEKIQSKNKGYVSDDYFKNQKNLKAKLLELNYRTLNHTLFNSKNEVDKLRKENSEMFKDIERMLLENLDYV